MILRTAPSRRGWAMEQGGTLGCSGWALRMATTLGILSAHAQCSQTARQEQERKPPSAGRVTVRPVLGTGPGLTTTLGTKCCQVRCPTCCTPWVRGQHSLQGMRGHVLADIGSSTAPGHGQARRIRSAKCMRLQNTPVTFQQAVVMKIRLLTTLRIHRHCLGPVSARKGTDQAALETGEGCRGGHGLRRGSDFPLQITGFGRLHLEGPLQQNKGMGSKCGHRGFQKASAGGPWVTASPSRSPGSLLSSLSPRPWRPLHSGLIPRSGLPPFSLARLSPVTAAASLTGPQPSRAPAWGALGSPSGRVLEEAAKGPCGTMVRGCTAPRVCTPVL